MFSSTPEKDGVCQEKTGLERSETEKGGLEEKRRFA